MKIRQIASIRGGQDGAIFGKYLFRFGGIGNCRVYELDGIEEPVAEPRKLEPISEFMLDQADRIAPHSNAVCFGREFYAEGDEFPLLYSNIYNNYAKTESDLCGVCCVYRLQRNGTTFSSALVQLIEIGFTDDREYWRSAGEVSDVRPYGNFVVDREKGLYYAYVMRDGDKTTRYFSFDLPKLSDGEKDETFGVNRVRLSVSDIKSWFDTPYHNFVQGACCHDGKIYSVEGFDERIRPALRIISPEQKQEVFFADLYEAGFPQEAEFIDFYRDRCIYIDSPGNLFEVEF